MSSVPVTVAGRPSVESDAAVARFLERFLAAEQPGMSWAAVKADGDVRELPRAA